MIDNMIKGIQEHLKNASDAELVRGYNKALEDYKKTKNEYIKVVADAIKKEIDRRKLVIDDEKDTTN